MKEPNKEFPKNKNVTTQNNRELELASRELNKLHKDFRGVIKSTLLESDGSEKEINVGSKITIGEKSYLVVYSPKHYREGERSEIAEGFKIFEIKENQEFNECLEIKFDRYNFEDDASNGNYKIRKTRLVGEFNGKKIDMPFVFYPKGRTFTDTTQITESLIPLLTSHH
jgi:hypothetical protein